MLTKSWLATSFLVVAKLCSGTHLNAIESALGVKNFEVPSLDLSGSNNEEIQLLGNFQSLNYYRYTGQDNFTGISDEKARESLIYHSNGTLLELSSPQYSNESFSVDHVIPLRDDSFILSGTGAISGAALDHQVMFNLSDLSYTAIFNQSLSPVNAITVNGNKAYFGGSFKFKGPDQDTHGLIVWDFVKNEVETLPFGGLGKDSNVNSILVLDDDNILFAGNFSTIDEKSALNSTLGINSTSDSAPELSHKIPLKTAKWTSDGSLQKDDLVCPSNSATSAWLGTGTTGQFELSIAHTIRPSKLRLHNARTLDEEVSLFRVITTPSNGIMNLTYLDPSSGELRTCDAWCPLLSTQNLTAAKSKAASTDQVEFLNNQTTVQWSESYQDFAFVNSVPVTSITFMALDSYGSSVGLNGFELYEDDFSVYANDSFNVPDCSSTSNYSKASLSASQWDQGSSDEDYVYTLVENSQEAPSVTFYPQIVYSGLYTINVLTPGCLADGSCQSRSVVNASLWDSNNGTLLSSITIYQNNDYEKYDNLYSGYLENEVKVVLEYEGAIGNTEGSPMMVAGQISVNTDEFDSSVFTDKYKTGKLNGLLHYSLSNSSSYLQNFKSKNSTDVAQYSVSNFAKNSNFFVDKFKDYIMLFASSGKVSKLEIDQQFDVKTVTTEEVGDEVSGVFAFSEGLGVIGAFDGSTKGAKFYNGSFFDIPLSDSNVTTFTNFTLDGAELVSLGNYYAINTTTDTLFRNSSKMTLTARSAGLNNLGETVLYGSLTRNEYTDLNGSFFISSNSQSSSRLRGSQGRIWYDATYIDNSTTGYAFYDPSSTNGSYGVSIYKDMAKERDLSYRWTNMVGSMLYSKNSSLLALGMKNETRSPQLLLTNLTTGEDTATFEWKTNVSINSLIFFDQNTSVLVGGDFNESESNCSGLCLFDYERKHWSPFFDNMINGSIHSMKIFNKSSLVLGGSFDMNDTKQVNLASMSLTDGSYNIIHQGTETILDFIFVDGKVDNLVAVSANDLFRLTNNNWESISAQFDDSSVFGGLSEFPIQQGGQNKKREEEKNSLLITGDLLHKTYGKISAALYDFNDWIPYFSTTPATSTDGLGQSRIYSNKDISSAFNYQGVLQSSRGGNSSSVPSGTSSPTSSSPSQLGAKKNKIARGFVVLIGLALAMGTLAVMGVIGIALTFFFGKSSDKYQSLEPRADESEMIDTVPPEKLMRFI